MNDVPLVKDNNINSINTSIIAIKKQLKQFIEAVGLIDVPDVDTSVFVKKSEVVDVVEEGNMNPVTSNAVVPVDEVTVDNMQSVTSNAVAQALEPTIYRTSKGALDVSGANWIRKVDNIPAGTYLAMYGFGYIEASSGYVQFSTSDANAVISTSLCCVGTSWSRPVSISSIITITQTATIGLRGYDANARIKEEANGKGLTIVKLK